MKFNFSNYITNIVICFIFNSYLFSQLFYNVSQNNDFDLEMIENSKNSIIYGINSNNRFSIRYIQSIYYNSNLPNLENHNGFYFPKGYGIFSSISINYNSKFFSISADPTISRLKTYLVDYPHKDSMFSVLNDVPIKELNNQFGLRNSGIRFNYHGLSSGFGNWNQWWGPGIHNSLVLSNNSESFYYYFFGTTKYNHFYKDIFYHFKFIVSDKMVNWSGDEYFFSAWFFNIKYKYLEIGLTRNILSGGYDNIKWSSKDAFITLFNNNKIKYWDTIDDYYIIAKFPENGIELFLEIGYPNRSFGGKSRKIYSDHSKGSNLGLRKKGVFDYKYLVYGFEYARLVQGIYYNILPTPNWYDNIKYNYSSYKMRRWAAHSGADSDDLLIYFGYSDKNKSLIYGINFERHGVTFHFPPEVKFENRISARINFKNYSFYLFYENEYFEHYGFVDSNENVWTETFSYQSIQRTNTLLFKLVYNLLNVK